LGRRALKVMLVPAEPLGHRVQPGQPGQLGQPGPAVRSVPRDRPVPKVQPRLQERPVPKARRGPPAPLALLERLVLRALLGHKAQPVLPAWKWWNLLLPSPPARAGSRT
jgi:hypothetical protein